MFPKPSLSVPKPPLLLAIVALCTYLATTVFGQIANHSFEQAGVTWSGSLTRAIQRSDGKIWVIYEQSQDEHDVIDRFDVPRLFKTTIVQNSGERIAGSDRLFEIGNRFTFGFFAMATQADNKLLLGIETGELFRLNADGSLDLSFHPQVSQEVGDVAVQLDGNIIVAPELVRLYPDGSKDLSFNSQLGNESPHAVALQSSQKIVVALASAPYLKRLNPNGSVDLTFIATLPDPVYSMLVLPDEAILVRLYHVNPDNSTTFTLMRLKPDGSVDPAFHPDSRFDVWHAAQNDGKILAAFRDPNTGYYFLGRMNPDGTIDASYQTYSAGRTVDYLNPISAVFVQPDGTILAQILSSPKGQEFLRFSSTGVLDTGSKTVFKIPGPVTKLAAQSDGKLLVTGSFNFVDGAETGALVRLESNGNLDATFQPPMFDSITGGVDLALQSSDSILFSGYGTNGAYRLTPNGSVDSGFARNNLGWRFVPRSDDRIVTTHYDNLVRRIHSDGNPDLSFSPTQVGFGGNQGDATVAFAIQTDGKIVVIGDGLLIGGIHSAPVKAGVVRLNPDGGIDSDFNPPAFNSGSRFNCVAIQADGKILLGGRFDTHDGSGIANLIRLNSDGSVDHTFLAVPDFTVSAILVEYPGTILIGGGFSNINGQPASRVARVGPNGQLDPSFHLDTGGGAVYALTTLADGRIVAGGEFGLVASPALPPSRLRNISTRMFVDTGDNALIGGIIITGSGDKKLLLRGIGPSLTGAGIAGALQDPNLELRNANGVVLASNDDWQTSTNKQAIIDTTIPPTDPKEAAIVITVPANGATYTAIVRPARGNAGIGMAEVYDLDGVNSSSKLANISARGNVLTGDKAMIGGFIVGGPADAGPARVMIRALGPSIPLSSVLQDPTLELHTGSTTLATNDDWKQPHQLQIEETTIPPTDDRESAITRWTPPGAYSAVVRGKAGSSGISLLEIYNLAN